MQFIQPPIFIVSMHWLIPHVYIWLLQNQKSENGTKIEMVINLLKKYNPGKEITVLAIAGGDACDWERKELRNTFCKNHPELKLKQLGDFEDLESWLDKNHPA